MLEIIAKVERLGPISEERKQTIELSEVAAVTGDFCEGETRAIWFLTPKEQRNLLEILKKAKEILGGFEIKIGSS